MRATFLILGLIWSVAAFTADAKVVKSFFHENKIGYSADFGVFKKENDYVISVHGFDKDLDVCLEIVAMLNTEQPDTYSCKPLNH